MPSAENPQDTFDLKIKLAFLMVKLFIPSVYQDIVKPAKVIRGTNMDWTIVRLPLLNNNPKEGRVNAGYIDQDKVNLLLSRDDLVDFLRYQIEDIAYIQKALAISN